MCKEWTTVSIITSINLILRIKKTSTISRSISQIKTIKCNFKRTKQTTWPIMTLRNSRTFSREQAHTKSKYKTLGKCSKTDDHFKERPINSYRTCSSEGTSRCNNSSRTRTCSQSNPWHSWIRNKRLVNLQESWLRSTTQATETLCQKISWAIPT